MNRLNSSKYVQYFDAHSSNHKKENEKKRKENIQFTTFGNKLNITKSFELARGNLPI